MDLENMNCPLPLHRYPNITMAHGGGGTLTQELIEKIFKPVFASDLNNHDSAVLVENPAKLAFTTDSFVVRPLFFPGGDIGSLAVHGTVNDLAMSGAIPKYLSVSFILEEGLPIETLWQIVKSMGHAARLANVTCVTGDTKVVEKGHGDGIYINTTGIGHIHHNLNINAKSIQPGDVIILSGDVGRHGVAVMASRGGLSFETSVQSDSAAVAAPILDLLHQNIKIHCLRDCTRGGVVTSLNEIAMAANLSMQIQESKVKVLDEVRGACEFLGLDPLYVANEGCFVVIVPEDEASRTLDILKNHPVSQMAAIIGKVENNNQVPLIIETIFGNKRIAGILSGEQLPRIC